MNDILLKMIKKAGLVGRGGAEFPTYLKWQAVKKAKETPKYVICNASEGEMGVFKDFYILKNYPEEVIRGMVLAMDFLDTNQAHFNLNENYHKKLHKKLEPIIKKYEKQNYCFKIFKEKPSYIGGEETTLLNAIEGKRAQPRLKPPYPSDSGLFGKPTLIHNVETLFNITKVASGTYEDKRFYCISGKVKKNSVHHLPDDWNIEKILKETGNYPDFDFFVQIGGSASGLVFNKNQLNKHKMTGAGSIEIFPSSQDSRKFLLRLFKFYKEESCGKCGPCREGSYQLYKLIKNNKKIPWKEVGNIVEAMGKTSFCGLGQFIRVPVESYIKNILKK